MCRKNLLCFCVVSDLKTSVISGATFQPCFLVLVPAKSLWKFFQLCSKETDGLLTSPFSCTVLFNPIINILAYS